MNPGLLEKLSHLSSPNLPFKEEETEAQGHTARGANQGHEPVSVNFSQELFPVTTVLSGVLSSSPLPFFPPVTPILTYPTLLAPNSLRISRVPKSPAARQAHCTKGFRKRFKPPTHPNALDFPRLARPTPPPAPRQHPCPRRARPPQAPPLAAPLPRRGCTHAPALSPVKPLGVEDLCFGFAALHWRGALAHGAWARGHLLVTGPRHPPLLHPLPSPAVAAAATAAGPARPPSL